MNPVFRFGTLILASVLYVVIVNAQDQTATKPRPQPSPPPASSQDAGLKLEPPPTLQPMPSSPQLSAEAKNQVDEVLKNYSNDQVSAYFALGEVAVDKKATPSGEQRKWLQDALILLKPRAIAMLNHDLRVARSRSDLRDAYIASLTLLSVAENNSELVNGLTATFPTLSDLMKKSFQQESEPVWEITDATGEFMSSYTEGPNYSNQIEVRPNKDGYRFLRVKAQVKNISKSSDPAYTGWALTRLKRITLEDGRGKTTNPTRLAGETFIHAVTVDYTQSFPCTFVTRENKILRNQGTSAVMDILGGSLLGAGGDAAKAAKAMLENNGGSFVEQGTTFDIDVLFPVPQNVNSFRSVIIGSAAVPIQIKGN